MLCLTLDSRLDEIEDRSQRCNLLLRGIPDARETWEQSEALVKQHSRAVLCDLPESSIERAHRLGTYATSKCRPIIVKFSNLGTKNAVLSVRQKLKEQNIAVSEDFSLATRQVHKELTIFAKNQPGEPSYQLCYKKLVINKKQYVYDPISATIKELPTVPVSYLIKGVCVRHKHPMLISRLHHKMRH